MDLHNIKKETNDSVNTFLQKVKDARDRLAAVGVQIDNKEILHIVLRGLPHEYHAFSVAIRTRNDATSFEDIHVLLIAEEQSLKSSIDLAKDHLIWWWLLTLIVTMLYFPIKETEDEEGITSLVDEAETSTMEAEEIITMQVGTQATVWTFQWQ